MLYALLSYGDEDVDLLLQGRGGTRVQISERALLSAAFVPSTATVTFRRNTVTDGPASANREQLLRLEVIAAEGLDHAIDIARESMRSNPGTTACEVRSVFDFTNPSRDQQLKQPDHLPI